MIERINYAIDKIGQRTIFDVDYPLLDSLDLAMQRKPSITKGWLNEFSALGMECLRESSIRKSLYSQKQRDSKSSEGTTIRTDPSFTSKIEKLESTTKVFDNILE